MRHESSPTSAAPTPGADATSDDASGLAAPAAATRRGTTRGGATGADATSDGAAAVDRVDRGAEGGRSGHAEYLARVMAEIEAEVRRRRASGDIPPGLERELDEMFLHFAPVGLSGKARLRETLALVDGATHIDIAVPTASEKAVGSQVKRLIRSTMSWYMGFIVHQVVQFHWATSRMFHVVADRLESLEAGFEAQRVPELPRSVAPLVDLATGWWSEAAVDALAGVRGRVLHGDCGDGALLDRLVAAGIDAYGVDPVDQLVELAADRGLDVRAEDLLGHLEVVGPEELAGAVVSGSVQWLSPAGRDRLAELLATRLAPDGVLVLHSSTPEHWAATADPAVLDLAPGRPLHAETWGLLLAERGFAPPRVKTGGGAAHLDPVPSSAEGAAEVNAAIDVLNRLLLGPNEYVLVTAREG